jgi:NADH dehydrogenase/NADH:ubiquinone oxidoreductase subunit G
MPTLEIDGRKVTVDEGAYILEAATRAGVPIPTLCAFDGLEPWGGCRLCVVDMWRPGWDHDWFKMVTACNHPAEDGITVFTDTERVLETRRVVLDLLLARCPDTPLIQRLAAEHGIDQTSYLRNPEPTTCILCGLCTRVCDHIGVSAIASVDRGAGREIAPPFHEPPPDCIGCLACAEICPTDHIPFTSSNVRREIWGREFEMLRCSGCGRAHITVAQADYWAGRNGVPRSYFETCDRCKRAAQAATFAKLSNVAG